MQHISDLAFHPQRIAHIPFLIIKLSRPSTGQPSASNRSHRCDPRNPAAPVTTARMIPPENSLASVSLLSLIDHRRGQRLPFRVLNDFPLNERTSRKNVFYSSVPDDGWNRYFAIGAGRFVRIFPRRLLAGARGSFAKVASDPGSQRRSPGPRNSGGANLSCRLRQRSLVDEATAAWRSEEHTSELQSLAYFAC